MTAEPVRAWIRIDAPPERVWEFFTRPEAIIRWMGEYAVLDPQPGGEFTVDVKGAPVRGRYLELDPPHRLLLSWGYAGSRELPPGASTVEVRLVRDGAGTRVHLEHRDLPEEETPGHAEGWTHYLARLSAAGSGDPGPDPGMRPVRPAVREGSLRSRWPRFQRSLRKASSVIPLPNVLAEMGSSLSEGAGGAKIRAITVRMAAQARYLARPSSISAVPSLRNCGASSPSKPSR